MNKIQTNNADLQSILDVINSLPDKIEGAEYGTCNVFFNGIGEVSSVEVICLILNTDNGIPEYITTTPPHFNGQPLPIPCVRNSILYCYWKSTSNYLSPPVDATVLCEERNNDENYLVCQINSVGNPVQIFLA